MHKVGIAWLSPLWALIEIVRALEVGFSGAGVASAVAVVFGIGVISCTFIRPALIGLLLIPAVLGVTVMTAIGYTLFPRFFFFPWALGC